MELDLLKESRENLEELLSLLNDMQSYTEEEYQADFLAVWKEAKDAIVSVLYICQKEEDECIRWIQEHTENTETIYRIDMSKMIDFLGEISLSTEYTDTMYKVKKLSAYIEFSLELYKVL